MKKISQGFTLAELIVSSAILLLMTVFASYLFVSGWRHFRYGSTEVDQLRMGRKIIHQISQDIML
ncbi:MAG: prepilin-type N-terminal cleavage/methylation domain-containing protein, partial [Armatimonadetes bacterium]|nr:prepilin-type N-terminal cleavage/methylation domain-containing protein [Armatimonadota bacterium]